MLLRRSGSGSGSSAESLVAGEDVSVGDLIAIDQSTGTNKLANANLSGGKYFVFAVAKTAATSGNNFVATTTYGALVAVRFGAAPPSSANGDPVFLDDTSGRAVLVPPDVSTATRARYFVGQLVGADGASTTPTVRFHPRLVAYKL